MASTSIRNVPVLVRRRQQRRTTSRRYPAGRAGLTGSVLGSLAFVCAVLAAAQAYTSAIRDLPSPQAIALLLEPQNGALLHPTRLYDRSGGHVLLTLENQAGAGTGESTRVYLPIDANQPKHIPETLIQATISRAEPLFWKSPGFSLHGLGQGTHPTLAQRLVSELLLWEEPTGLRRDIRERLLASQVIAQYGHPKVLEWYLNSARYGNLIFGAEAASQVYFGKPSTGLSIAEAAWLAGVAEAPELDPLTAPQLPLERQKVIIELMQSNGLISKQQALLASQESLHFRKPSPRAPELAPAFTRLVLKQIATRFPLERIERGGFEIRTTLDYDLQRQTNCALQAQLSHFNPNSEAVTTTLAGEGECEASRLLPALPIQIAVTGSKWGASVIVLDPRTGQILAMAGDLDTGSDLTHWPYHTPGTILTPFIALTALSKGWSPASLLWDIPATPLGKGGQPGILPVNENYHGPVSLRTALANDYLPPTVSILRQVGAQNAWRTARQLGLQSLEPADFQTDSTELIPFLRGKITLLEVVQGFGVFANQGTLAGQEIETTGNMARPLAGSPDLTPLTVITTQDIDHQIWMDCREASKNCSPKVRPVVSPQLAYLVTNVLSDETARWPSLKHPNPLEIGRPAGAKLGRVLGDNQGWAVGYTPQVVVGVWFGNVDSITQSSEGKTSALDQAAVYGAAGLWHAVIQYASRNQPVENWNMPPSLIRMDVCDPSGLLPSPSCPNITSEVFIPGNEPVYADTLYQVFKVNRDTGRLATVFTPPELVVDRVFLVVPPEAQDWARLSGLPTVPDTYDVVSAPKRTSLSVEISNPGMFSYIHGKVKINGSAEVDGFSSYRLQAGAGLNPQKWLQVGSDSTHPVRDDLLGEWDTSGLNGLYAVQLLVIGKDQRVDTAIIQVTVDNQPPEIRILQPSDRQEFLGSSRKAIVFEAAASDNLSLEHIEMWVDQEEVASLSQAPYLIAWSAKVGDHTLLCRAYDMAGNSAEAVIHFTVKQK